MAGVPIAFDWAPGNTGPAFPDVGGGHWQVTSGGATRPQWSLDGRELFFLDAENRLTSVLVHVQTPRSGVSDGRSALAFDAPRQLLDASYYSGTLGRTYDVSNDGRRFVMIEVANPASDGIVVVLDWIDELKAKLPVN